MNTNDSPQEPPGQMYSMRTGQARPGDQPSKRAIQHRVRKIHALTADAMVWQETTALMSRLNRMHRGRVNYFQVGAVSRAYYALESYTTMRLRRWLCNKHKVRRCGKVVYPDAHLYETLCLVRLSRLECNATDEGVMFCPKSGCGKSACPI
jgi:hypothetical protein